jgi:hypothetical protein
MPQLLVHRLKTAPFVEYDDLVAAVKRFPIYHFLNLCNQFANKIDSTPQVKLLVKVPMLPGYSVAPDSEIYLTQSCIAFLAKLSVMHGSDHRRLLPNGAHMICLAYLDANLKEPSEHGLARARSLIVRNNWEQEPFRGNLARSIPRSKLFLIDGNRSAEKRPIDLDEVWTRLTGLDLEKFMLVGFGYYAGLLQHNRVTRYFPSRGFLADKISAGECDTFLSRAGGNYDELRARSAERRAEDRLYAKSELNVLLQRPLVIRGPEVLAPVPRLVANRIVTEGIFFDIRDSMESSEDSETLNRYFGYLFEQYVGRILRWTFGPDKVHPEPVYRRNRQQVAGVDWTVLDGDVAILFECRSGRFTLDTNTYGRPEDISSDIRRIFGETIRKFPDKLEDIRAGRVPIDLSGVSTFEHVVVLSSRITFEGEFRRIASEELEQRELAPFDDYHLVDIENLETLSAWNTHHAMKDLLRTRRMDPVENEDFGDYVYRLAVENKLRFDHPLLEAVLDGFFEQFDIERPHQEN